MANRLGKIYCTEEDKVNCPFYFKIGACRHGDKCIRIHNKPVISQTVLFKHMYQNPPVAISIAEGNKVSDEALKEAIKHFEDFYEEVFLELSNFGEVIELNVCDNLGDHLIGNVYAKFSSEEDAEKAVKELTGKFYAGKPIVTEYSPVTDFRECRCRQYEEGSCGRGGYCNFMHLKYISKNFKNSLFDQMYVEHPDYKDHKKKYKPREKSEEKVKKRRKNSSSESDLADRNSEERRRIIDKWNKRYERQKDEEKKKREVAEARINLVLLEQKLQENVKKLKEGKMNAIEEDKQLK